MRVIASHRAKGGPVGGAGDAIPHVVKTELPNLNYESFPWKEGRGEL